MYHASMTFDKALRILATKYPGNVTRRSEAREVVINILPTGFDVKEPVILTDEQATFLASHPLSDDDLFNEKFPDGWPS